MLLFTRIRIGAALAGVAVLSVAMLPGVAAAEVPSSQVPAELKAAIEQYIEGQGHDYVGFCRNVNENPGSIVPGTYCAFVNSIKHDIAEVTYGPVLSDEISRVSFKLENGQWKVMTQATPTATTTPTRTATAVTTPRAPATGSGANPDSNGEDNPTIILTVAFATAAGLGALATMAARRR